jgi:hypothetical protein
MKDLRNNSTIGSLSMTHKQTKVVKKHNISKLAPLHRESLPQASNLLY